MAATQNTTFRGKKRIKHITGEVDIDIGAADYTSFQTLLTIAPQAGRTIKNAKLTLDLAKATTGFAAGHTTETIQFTVARKVDGTNYRRRASEPATALTGTLAALRSLELDLGTIGPTETVRIDVVLSAENAVDVEFPYVLSYEGADPAITEVAA